MRFASKKDELRQSQLQQLRKLYIKRLVQLDNEMAGITRRAKWTFEEIMRREG